MEVFKRRMDSLFDDFFELRPSTLFESTAVPDVDVEETEKSYLVRADMPGYEIKDVSVSLDGGVLTISGERRKEQKTGEGKALISECSFGSFRRSIALGSDADSENASAAYDKGVLRIEIPKASARQKIRIDVK